MKKVGFPLTSIFFYLLPAALIMSSCFSYRQVSYYDDEPNDAEAYQQPVVTYSDPANVGYKNYFGSKVEEYSQEPAGNPVFTDIDSYSSVSVGATINGSPDYGYNPQYAGWGANNTQVINVFPSGGWGGWYASPSYWGWNTYYGYYGPYTPTWGWNTYYGSNWGWNAGWAASGWYSPYWGSNWGWNTGFYCPPAWGWNTGNWIIYSPYTVKNAYVYHNTPRNYNHPPRPGGRFGNYNDNTPNRYNTTAGNYNNVRTGGSNSEEAKAAPYTSYSKNSSSYTPRQSQQGNITNSSTSRQPQQNQNTSSYNTRRTTATPSSNRSSNSSNSNTTSTTRSGGTRRGGK
jgi:hypothetical protein